MWLLNANSKCTKSPRMSNFFTQFYVSLCWYEVIDNIIINTILLCKAYTPPAPCTIIQSHIPLNTSRPTAPAPGSSCLHITQYSLQHIAYFTLQTGSLINIAHYRMEHITHYKIQPRAHYITQNTARSSHYTSQTVAVCLTGSCKWRTRQD